MEGGGLYQDGASSVGGPSPNNAKGIPSVTLYKGMDGQREEAAAQGIELLLRIKAVLSNPPGMVSVSENGKGGQDGVEVWAPSPQ